jgi:hypothetical protein
MNSNRFIEVDSTRCNACQKLFYELRNYELSDCPHCEIVLEHKGSCNVEGGYEVRIEVDSKTGKLRIV